MVKHIGLVLLIVLFSCCIVKAQNSVLDVGIRLQKAVNLYHENGFAINYSSKGLMPDRLYFGFNYVTSRLGSAINSNAIKQDNFLLSSAYYFRPTHIIRPFVRGNVGFFSASYGDKMFDDLPQSSLLLSADAGLSFQTHTPLKIATSLGYNAITGNGTNGPGTLYPVYYQLTLSWNIFNHNK